MSSIKINTDPFFQSNLDKLRIEPMQTFKPDCVRKRANWSNITGPFQFEKAGFNAETMRNELVKRSPKLDHLLKHIDELDKRDLENSGTLYKHFIFTDLKSSTFGAKMIASGLIAHGKQLGFQKMTPKVSLTVRHPKGGALKSGGKVAFKSPAELSKTHHQNFYLLSSVAVYGKPLAVSVKKEILSRFNQRPENAYGQQVRFIVLDSGFKEGIDLYDVKYVHIFEPPTNMADQKQIIGRGTRKCGQAGLTFHPTRGWPLHVFIYDLVIPPKIQSKLMFAETLFDVYLKTKQVDLRLLAFAQELEEATIVGAVDYELTKQIHDFSPDKQPVGLKKTKEKQDGGSFADLTLNERGSRWTKGGSFADLTLNERGSRWTKGGAISVVFPQKRLKHDESRAFILKNFMDCCQWKNIVMENRCIRGKQKPVVPSETVEKEPKLKVLGGGALSCEKQEEKVVPFSPTQEFIHRYFTPENPIKGMLLWQGTGVGKTCTAIATATDGFERQGYTILWVTRTTLKEDIWKNMFDTFICHQGFRDRLQQCALDMPNERKDQKALLSKAWNIRPMSYKQFSNLVSKKNSFYTDLVKINGEEDPLKRTLLIIDEAHKLYGGNDLNTNEKPDMDALHYALMRSYELSGVNSVRLLLMTATPITVDAMELIKLVNLCKPAKEQMPDHFYAFTDQYLEETTGSFTVKGRKRYLDDIAGYISYLNLEKDAREFSQPVITRVPVPLFRDEKEMQMFIEDDGGSSAENQQLELEQEQVSIVDEIEKYKGLTKWVGDNWPKKKVLERLERESGCSGDKKCLKEKQVAKQATDIANKIKEIQQGYKSKVADLAGDKKALIERVMTLKKKAKFDTKKKKDHKDGVFLTLLEKCPVVEMDTKTMEKQLLLHPVVLSVVREIEGINEERDKYLSEIELVSKDFEIKTRFLNMLPPKARREEIENNPEFLRMFSFLQKRIEEIEPVLNDLQERRKELVHKKHVVFQHLKKAWLKEAQQVYKDKASREKTRKKLEKKQGISKSKTIKVKTAEKRLSLTTVENQINRLF